MTESFGSCEAAANDVTGISGLAEQAAAQGITYFVSTGDSGAEGCDDPDTETSAIGPVSVNVLASTDFNVAVGGTMFNENGQDSLYWSTTNTDNESAVSYIPEDVWNESCQACTNPAIWAGGGGRSIFSTPKPSWQSGAVGIPQDGARDLPDVSLTAAGHDAYIVCLEGSCVPDSSGNFFIYLISGTSASTPSFAGIMAMVEQQVANTNSGASSRQGQANYVFYRLAATENGTLASCDGSNVSLLPASTCVFNDVAVGNNAVPGEINYGSSTSQYQAGTGYDQATGLGSVNITNLINQWNTVTFNPTTTTLTFTPAIVNIAHGSSASATVTVAPATGTLAPTGDVSLIAASAFGVTGQTAVGFFTLNNGTATQSTSQLPGGTYNVTANYAGDATYAPSFSTPVSVTVTPETSNTTLSVLPLTTTQTSSTSPVAHSAASSIYEPTLPACPVMAPPPERSRPPDTFGAIPGGRLVPTECRDTLNNGSNTATPNGVITFDTGTHTISATYGGDASFNASNSTQPITFTITPGFFAAIPGSASVVQISAAGGAGTSSITVSNSTGFSGTISLACSGLPAETTCAFSPASVAATGTAQTVSPTITVTTTAAHTVTQNLVRSRYYLAQALIGGGFALAGLCFIILPKGRRRALPLLLIVLALIVTVPACGGGGGEQRVYRPSRHKTRALPPVPPISL